MNESQHSEPQSHRIDQFEDEIVLMDYLVVIWKWKYLILVGTFLCAVATAVVSFQMPKVYAINTVLQPGILRVTQEGKTMYIDSAQNLKAIIETGTFDNQILRNIAAPNKDDVPESVGFEVQIPKGSNALEVSHKTPNVHLGLQILNNLNKAILERYGKLIKYYQENYDKEIRLRSNEVFKVNEKMTKLTHTISGIEAENEVQISEIANKTSAKIVEISSAEAESEAQIRQKDNKIETLKAQIKARENQIENLRKRIADVKLEISRISKNTDLLIEQRDNFLSSIEDGGSVLAGMIHANTVHQNIGFLNSLRSTITSTWSQIYQEKVGIERSEININDLEAEKESLVKQTKYRIERLQLDVKDLEAQKENLVKQTKCRIEIMKSETKGLESEKKYKLEQISSLEFMKNNIQNIEIIKPPRNSPYPIKPKTRRNVMLAAVGGFFLTVFIAFFIEYVSKYNNREHD